MLDLMPALPAWEPAATGEQCAVAALLGGTVGGRSLLQAAAAQLEPLLRNGTTGVVRLAAESGCHGDATAGRPAAEPITLLVEGRLPAARMLIFGANDVGAALLPAGRLDARTVVCVLAHDPKFDIPLLQTALGPDLAYIGAMGSRRSHVQRLESLLAAGVAPEDLPRLHSPIGLDLGAVTPAEVAVSITAELLAGRSRAAGAPAQAASLKDGAGPIHHINTPQHQEMPWT